MKAAPIPYTELALAQILDEKTRAALATYPANFRSKTHRFNALIEALPRERCNDAVRLRSGELIRIDTAAGKKKHGFIDSYYGKAVIEFQNSLKATGAEAERQLRGYVAGAWRSDEA